MVYCTHRGHVSPVQTAYERKVYGMELALFLMSKPFLLIFFPSLGAIVTIMWVLNALISYRIARQRGIPKPGLSFVPFVRHRMLGKAADAAACDQVNPCRHTRRLTGWLIALLVIVLVLDILICAVMHFSSLDIVDGIKSSSKHEQIPGAGLFVGMALLAAAAAFCTITLFLTFAVGLLIYHGVTSAAVCRIASHYTPQNVGLYTFLYVVLPPLGAALLLAGIPKPEHPIAYPQSSAK